MLQSLSAIRKKRCFVISVATLASVVFLLFFLSRYLEEKEKKQEKEYLSVNDTLAFVPALAFMGAGLGHKAPPIPFHLFNPEAITPLRVFLRNEENFSTKHYGRSMYILGLIGNEEDLELIRYLVEEHYLKTRKNFGKRDYNFHMLGHCLGKFIARDIDGAKELFQKYADLFFWYDEDGKEKVFREEPKPRIRSFIHSAIGASNNNPDLLQYASQTWPDTKKPLFSEKIMSSLAKEKPSKKGERSRKKYLSFLKKFKRETGADDKYLNDLFLKKSKPIHLDKAELIIGNGYQNPKFKEQVESLNFANIVEGGRSYFFPKMRRFVEKNDMEKNQHYFLYNGKVINPNQTEPDFLKILQKKLETEKKINFDIEGKLFGDLGFFESTKITIEIAPSPAPNSKIVFGKGYHFSAIFAFEIVGTAQIAEKYSLQKKKNTITVSPNGNLQVYMRRIDGVWYWNPFTFVDLEE